MTDISMIFLNTTDKDILDETVLLSKRNMILKNRSGRKMLVIKPTPREQPIDEYKQNEEQWQNRWKMMQEFTGRKNKLTSTPYTMNDIVKVNNSPKLSHLFPELVVNDFSFNLRKW